MAHPFTVDHVRAVCPNPVMPPRIEPDSLEWGWRFCKVDFTSSNGYRWAFPGKWAKAPGPFTKSTNPCPSDIGDGVCLAKTITGAQSGGARFTDHVGLLVAYLAKDVLGQDNNKVRVKRAWVADVFNPLEAVRKAALIGADLYGADLYGADLYGADLYGANLYGANLYGADLRGANLYGADLRGANLYGADLYGANLRGAVYDEQVTLWPEGFDPKAAGAVKR